MVNQIIFSSILQTWYVELRISRSISESPLEFEITRVDCILNHMIWYFSYYIVNIMYLFLDNVLFPSEDLMDKSKTLCKNLYSDQRPRSTLLIHVLLVFLCRFLRYQTPESHGGSGECLVYMNFYSLASMDHHAHLVSRSVTRRHPVHFILNPGHVEYGRRCTNRLNFFPTRAIFEPHD